MWLKFIISFSFLLVLFGCESYDPESLTLELNPGVDTVEVNSDFVDAGAYATIGGGRYSVTVIENTVDLTTVGEYRIVYQTSFQDVTLTVVRIVDVIDETPPVLTLNPGIDTILVGDTWTDAGVTATDNSGLDVSIQIQGEVITSMAGEYVITYIATDAFGNQTEISRYVNVIRP